KVSGDWVAPVWLNADILPGPGGKATPLEARAFLQAMEELCRGLPHPVTFPVRAALLPQSLDQMSWLLQQSDRYTLTVWTGQEDVFAVQDLLPYRRQFEKSRIYYDLPDSERLELCKTAAVHLHVAVSDAQDVCRQAGGAEVEQLELSLDSRQRDQHQQDDG
ncbi:hypothetical protein CRUP_037882, partial [Coryphaenoides rupestris]